jgi:hypothetical protein
MPVNYLEVIAEPDPAGINKGLSSPSAAFMTAMVGNPRDSYTGECQDPTNAAFRKLIETRSVGPIRVTGLKPALKSLDAVFGDVKNELPDLYAIVGTAGMLCCRKKKLGGGRLGKSPSNHSFGTAVDLKLKGVLDPQGDNKTLRGLLILSKYFNAHGWVWGVSFPTEDAMHFEVARETLQKWRKEGLV